MPSAIDKLVENNDKNEEKEKDDAKTGKKKDKKPDTDKLLEEKKNIGYFDITGQQLKTDLLKMAKENKVNKLQDAQRIEKYWSDRLQEEGQKLESKYGPIINQYQERAQMAQSEADREYEQRIIEYIQRLYQAEKETIEKQLTLMQQNQQAREKGRPVSTDKISNLQVEAKAAMDKYDKYKDKLDKMKKAFNKQVKGADDKLDQSKDKQKDKNEEKQDKKTLDISGLKNVNNGKLDAGDLKDKKEEKKKSFLGL